MSLLAALFRAVKDAAARLAALGPAGPSLDRSAQLRWLASNVAQEGDVHRRHPLATPPSSRTTFKAPPTEQIACSGPQLGAHPHHIHAGSPGILAGAYNERDARRYARACLIPDELLERPTLNLHHAARALGVPVDELQAARADHCRCNSDT